MPQQITNENIGAFEQLYENYKSNPTFYNNHKRSAEILNAVKLYQVHLNTQSTPPGKTDTQNFTPSESYMPTYKPEAAQETQKPTLPDFIAEPKESGFSELMEVGGRQGRFNWDVPPKYSAGIGGGKVPMHRFETEDGGVWDYRIDKQGQGGRFEDAWHFPQDFEGMKKNPEIIEQW